MIGRYGMPGTARTTGRATAVRPTLITRDTPPPAADAARAATRLQEGAVAPVARVEQAKTHTRAEVATLLGVNERSLRRYLNEYSEYLPDSGAFDDVAIESLRKIRDAKAAGMKRDEIARSITQSLGADPEAPDVQPRHTSAISQAINELLDAANKLKYLLTRRDTNASHTSQSESEACL